MQINAYPGFTLHLNVLLVLVGTVMTNNRFYLLSEELR
jgi:hypothetical protein